MSKCFKCSAKMVQGDRFCPECGADQQTARFEGLMTVGGLETIDQSQTRGPSGDSQSELAEGTEFAGRYLIERIVGKGGMGVVYRAKDKLAEKYVALKLIRAERLGGHGAVKRLISEGLTARDIRHQNIVAVYDVGEAEGQPFVSMEYLDGQSLRDWHREQVRLRQDVPLRVAARIIAEILDGLTAAHAAGVIHRDLSPENIMLIGNPTEAAAPLKILDFGIARVAGSNVESGTGTGLGKPRYMAPEQVTNADSAGPSADLYSLSVIFYELLVDVLPQGHWQPPSGGRSDVPKTIDALIERGLSNRPANRFQEAKDYRRALVEAVNISGPGRTTRVVDQTGTKKETSMLPAGALKWGGIAAAGLLVIVLLASIMPGGGSPNASGVQALSGVWKDGAGSVYNMQVNGNGAFTGGGRNGYGYNVRMDGQFNGTSGTYTLTVPEAGMIFSGSMNWDSGCHVSFQTRDDTNSVIDQGNMHVNHEPGGPCP